MTRTIVRVDEAATAAGVRPVTVRKWVERGLLRYTGITVRAVTGHSLPTLDLAAVMDVASTRRSGPPRRTEGVIDDTGE